MSIVDTLNNKSLVEYIESVEHLQIEPFGDGTYRCICPLHEGAENPTSFTVFDDSNYLCFSCGSNGRLIDYVMDKNDLSFKEAIEKLAEEYGYDLKRDVKYKTQIQLSDEINRGMIEFEKHIDKCYKYVSNSRGISDEMIKKYHIGYWEKGNAVVIPQFNMYGLPVGFLYRFLDSDAKSKYKNSKNTELYVKGEHLFNLNNIRKTLKDKKCLYLCEGAFDSIACMQMGYPSLAYFGISLTKNHVNLIKEVTQRVDCLDIILVPDNDNKASKFISKARDLFNKIYPNANLLVADIGDLV